MDTSAISGSANGNGLDGQIQVSLLKKSQEMEASQVATLLNSAVQVGNAAAAQSANPAVGNHLDVTA